MYLKTGATLSTIIGLHHEWTISLAAVITVIYTITGGLRSVMYTDEVQLVCLFVGLWVCIPFALMHDAVTPIGETAWGSEGWLGELKLNYWLGYYIDSVLLVLLGGSAWSPGFQRMLSQESSRNAQIVCFGSCFGILIMSIQPIIIGAIAKSTDWNATSYRESGCISMRKADYQFILPLVLQYLTPFPVAVIGIGAIAAAVMSSSDSAVLSSASAFAVNVYKPIRNAVANITGKTRATEKEILWSLRVSTAVLTVIATVMALTVKSVYGLWFLAGDLNYVWLFPQLLMALHCPVSNTYGALAGTFVTVFLRFTASEVFLNFPPLFKYPWFDEDSGTQLFPFKTLCMVITLLVIFLTSYLMQLVFTHCNMPSQMDVFECFNKSEEGSKRNRTGHESKQKYTFYHNAVELVEEPTERYAKTCGAQTK